MLKIDIYYNKSIIEDEKFFKKNIDYLKSNFPYTFILHDDDKVDFEIRFNGKIIYSLDDNFDSCKSISKEVLLKSRKMLSSAVISSKSKVFPQVDDISIDEY